MVNLTDLATTTVELNDGSEFVFRGDFNSVMRDRVSVLQQMNFWDTIPMYDIVQGQAILSAFGKYYKVSEVNEFFSK